MKRIIGILFGGCSSEYEISLQSAYAVVTHLNRNQYEPVLIGITRKGEWFYYDGPAEDIAADTWHCKGACTRAVISPSRETHGLLQFSDGKVLQIHLDAVFPVLHGRNGEDGTVQGLLELAGIPIVGCDTLSSALCMDKDISHQLVKLAGIAVPEYVVLRRGQDMAEQIKSLTYPVFVKPARAGSSFGITKVDTPAELPDALREAFAHDTKVVVEQAVKGFEIGCAVLGNEEPICGEIDEIELSQGFFDFTEKYTLKTSQIHMPARIDAKTAERAKRTAAIIYRTLECRGCARVDMFLTPDGEIVFNEVNTIPGFTSHSRYPSMLGGIGLSFEMVLDRLIELAVNG